MRVDMQAVRAAAERIPLHWDPYCEDRAACGALASLGYPLGLTSDQDLVTCGECNDLPDDGLPGSPEADCLCERITLKPCPVHEPACPSCGRLEGYHALECSETAEILDSFTCSYGTISVYRAGQCSPEHAS